MSSLETVVSIDEVDSKAPPLENFIFDDSNNERAPWNCFGQSTPRSQVVFAAQVIVVFTIVLISIINLSLTDKCEETTVWVAILSSSVGYMLPSPKL